MNEIDLPRLEVVQLLPDYFDYTRGDPVPDDLVGSVIVNIGTIPVNGAVEGGGLVVDYRPHGSQEIRRIVLAFNDCGMWVSYTRRLTLPSDPGASPE
jgi:hypothetical protein